MSGGPTCFEGTKGENCQDMGAKGRARGHTVLTAEQVREIRALYRPFHPGASRRYDAGSQQSLAKKFGVSRGAIQRVVAGTSWRYLL